jgi:serine/threonine protein kinase/tetratricopeptide (TPR) repeat protein
MIGFSDPQLRVRAYQVFEDAIGLRDDERSVFLDESCDGDEALRGAVAALLDSAEAAVRSRFLGDPPWWTLRGLDLPTAPPLAEESERLIGQDVGGYRVEAAVGAGGFGAVYRAKHVVDGKLVAIKFLAPEVARASLGERRALARLEHDNIARLYGGGEHQGRPYLVMEFVDGCPIDAYCDGRGPADSPKLLTTRQRAELFRVVCEAVRYAHQNALIHRDLKPSNILVTAGGVVKLVDFGIARAPDGAEGENLGEPSGDPGRVCTPEYASPEQVRGEPLSVASDVYSLGVVLYELLAGRRPYRIADRRPPAVEALVCGTVPVPPSVAFGRADETGRVAPEGEVAARDGSPEATRRRLRGDLDAIVMKALEKAPKDRHSSAEKFAEELGLYLADRPITVRRSPAWERGWKWAKRHSTAAAAVALSCAAVTTLIVVGAIYNRLLTKQRDLAISKGIEATRQRDRALANLKLARESVDKYLTLASQDARLRDHDLEGLRLDLLKSVIPAYETFAHQQGDDPDIRLEMAKAHGRLGNLMEDVGTPSEAIDYFEKSIAILEDLVARNRAEPEYRRVLAGGYNDLGVSLRRQGEVARAMEAYENARKLRAGLVEDHPKDLSYKFRLAATLGNIANLHNILGRPEAAEANFQAALALFRQVAAADPADAAAQKGVGDALSNILIVYARTSRWEKAERAGAEALAIRQGLVEKHPGHTVYLRDLASIQTNLGRVYESSSRPQLAEETYLAATRTFEGLAATHPTITSFRFEQAQVFNNLGALYNDRADFAKAEGAYTRAGETLRKLVTAHRGVAIYEFELASVLNNLGLLESETGRSAAAEKSYREAEQLWRTLIQRSPKVPDHPNGLGKVLMNLGDLFRSTGRHGQAEAAYREVLVLRDTLIRDHPAETEYRANWTKARYSLALLYDAMGRGALAAEALKEVVERRKVLVGENPAVPEYRDLLANAFSAQGTNHDRAGRFDSAEACYREALDHRRRLAGQFPDNLAFQSDLAACHHDLGRVYARTRRPGEAESEFRQSLELQEKVARVHPAVLRFQRQLASTCSNLGDCLGEALGKPGEAQPYYDRSATILEELRGRHPRDPDLLAGLIEARAGRARNLVKLGRFADSLQDWEQVLGLETGPARDGWAIQRAVTLVRAGDHARAADTLDRIARGSTNTPANQFELARGYSLCVNAARHDTAITQPRRDQLAGRYADQAMERLKQAQAGGYLVESEVLLGLKTVPDWEPLRQRQDFKDLVRKTESSLQRIEPKAHALRGWDEGVRS